MWIPRDPDVFGQPTRPTSASASLARHRHVADLRPLDARHRVEIDPQLVGMVEVVGADGMRIEIDAAEVDDPDQSGSLVHDDLVGGPAGREGQLSGPDPVGRVVRCPLLEERLLGDPVDESLEGHRAAADAGQRAVGDSKVVLDQVELRVPGVREVHLLRVGDRHLATADLEDLLGRRHRGTIRSTAIPPGGMMPGLGRDAVDSGAGRSSYG